MGYMKGVIHISFANFKPRLVSGAKVNRVCNSPYNISFGSV